jgi:hypothetical protein
MSINEVAEFISDLPTGEVETEDGMDFLVYPGRPTLEAIGGILVQMGCELQPIVSAEFKGWDQKFRFRGRSFWIRVTQIERHVACFGDCSLWPRIIGRQHPLYVELLSGVADALDRDPRFHDVRWCTLKAFEPQISREAEPTDG